MRISGCMAVVVGTIASAALASSLSPSFAAGSGASSASAPRRLGLAPLFARPPGAASTRHLDARTDRPLPALAAVTGGPAEERLCSLQTLSEPALLAPPAPAWSFLAGRGDGRDYPSLGGPALTLTSPEALPSLRDPAAAPADPEDTLRLFRSHW